MHSKEVTDKALVPLRDFFVSTVSLPQISVSKYLFNHTVCIQGALLYTYAYCQSLTPKILKKQIKAYCLIFCIYWTSCDLAGIVYSTNDCIFL